MSYFVARKLCFFMDARTSNGKNRKDESRIGINPANGSGIHRYSSTRDCPGYVGIIISVDRSAERPMSTIVDERDDYAEC